MKKLLSIGVILSSFIFIKCDSESSTEATFQGELEAVKLAEKMFKAIGGKARWCELNSLYIKAIHTEPQLENPYTSQIWRAIDHFKLVIEQNNEDFHAKAEIDSTQGKITYLDKRDTFRILTEEQLANWKHDHQHNIYVLLHDLGCTPSNYLAKIEENGRLSFYQNETLVTSFELDDQLRPHIFYAPNPEGELVGSRFRKWGTDNGLVHSAGGHPLDSNFIYDTEIWQGSEQSFDAAFPNLGN